MDFAHIIEVLINFIFNLIETALPALILAGVAYFLFNKYMEYIKERDKRMVSMSNVVPPTSLERQNTMALPLRMQAYERLVLFSERISLHNLSLRVLQENMSAKDFQFAMMAAIKQEYDHNISQQVYVSENLWKIVTFAKNDTVNVINLVAKELPKNADAQTLNKALFQYLKHTSETALDKARSAISQEAATVL